MAGQDMAWNINLNGIDWRIFTISTTIKNKMSHTDKAFTDAFFELIELFIH